MQTLKQPQAFLWWEQFICQNFSLGAWHIVVAQPMPIEQIKCQLSEWIGKGNECILSQTLRFKSEKARLPLLPLFSVCLRNGTQVGRLISRHRYPLIHLPSWLWSCNEHIRKESSESPSCRLPVRMRDTENRITKRQHAVPSTHEKLSNW